MTLEIRNAVVQPRRSEEHITRANLVFRFNLCLYSAIFSLSFSRSFSSSFPSCSPGSVAFRASLSRFAVASFNLHAACVYAVNKAPHRERPVCTRSGTLLIGPHHRREPELSIKTNLCLANGDDTYRPYIAPVVRAIV